MFRFRPRLERLENRETPSPIGPEPIDPSTPPSSPPPQSDPTPDPSQPADPIG